LDIYIGFDSAWADRARAPGAICAVAVADDHVVDFYPPELVSFDGALTFIERVRSGADHTLVALDQPTIVPNLTGMRPVERVAASVVSWVGGGVQPANRGRLGMFCDLSPIWRFLASLGAAENPELGRSAVSGLHVIEVFPALALLSLETKFFERLRGPRYNPARKKTFRLTDWIAVADAAAREADVLGCGELARWCRDFGMINAPRKSDQDMMDAALCTLIALRWRLRERAASLLLGDLTSGYMVVPTTFPVRAHLARAAKKYAVPMDGVSL
jgi:predicted RNase H-like nuclease